MLEFNLRTVEAEIEKLAFSKMEISQQAERLGALYNAQKCLLNLIAKKGNNNKADTENRQITGKSQVTDELNDILPALKEYLNAKTDFSQHKITQEGVNYALQKLVVEINEFIVVLNSNTTSPEEREILTQIKAVE